MSVVRVEGVLLLLLYAALGFAGGRNHFTLKFDCGQFSLEIASILISLLYLALMFHRVIVFSVIRYRSMYLQKDMQVKSI